MKSIVAASDPWRRFRLHRWILFGGWLGWIPYGALVYALAYVIDSKIIALWLVAPYGIAWMANNVALAYFRCPRCGQRFSYRGLYGNSFTLTCLNCGQRAYEPLASGAIEKVPFRYW